MSAMPPAAPVVGSSDPGAPFCPDCGYDLRGIESSQRCPECGLSIDRDALATSRIPWAQRQRIGRVRAYWRTVWAATFQGKTFAREVARPVSHRDAQRFRLITTLLAFAVPLAGVTLASWHEAHKIAHEDWLDDLYRSPTGALPAPTGMMDVVFPWIAGVTLWPVIPLASLAFVLIATGLPSYWFHPRALPVVRQNRAVALSHYACAPLALLLVPAAVFGLIVGLAKSDLSNRGIDRSTLVLLLATYALVPLILLGYYVGVLRMLHRTTHAGMGRLVGAALGLPVAWAAAAVLLGYVMPWLVGFARIVIESATR